MIVEIYRAKLRSVAVAARQEGIALPPGWLAEYEKAEHAAIAGLARGPAQPHGPPAYADLQRAAEAALKDLGESGDLSEPRPERLPDVKR